MLGNEVGRGAGIVALAAVLVARTTDPESSGVCGGDVSEEVVASCAKVLEASGGDDTTMCKLR